MGTDRKGPVSRAGPQGTRITAPKTVLWEDPGIRDGGRQHKKRDPVSTDSHGTCLPQKHGKCLHSRGTQLLAQEASSILFIP